MKVELKLSPDTLLAINNVLQNVYSYSIGNIEVLQKVHRSIGFQLAETFEKKVKSQLKKHNLFEADKKIKISFKYYEAWSLHAILIDLIGTADTTYQKTLIQKTINEINQKL